jgi:hypothetical protein
MGRRVSSKLPRAAQPHSCICIYTYTTDESLAGAIAIAQSAMELDTTTMNWKQGRAMTA